MPQIRYPSTGHRIAPYAIAVPAPVRPFPPLSSASSAPEHFQIGTRNQTQEVNVHPESDTPAKSQHTEERVGAYA
eukprot:183217-Rhodomonas_salina.1